MLCTSTTVERGPLLTALLDDNTSDSYYDMPSHSATAKPLRLPRRPLSVNLKWILPCWSATTANC